MKTSARIICVVVLAVLAVAGTTFPVQAKGPTDVTVSGPGIDDVHLTFTERIDVDSGTLGRASRLYDMWSPGQLGPAPGLSADDLGPRYVLTWSGDPHSRDSGENLVVQHAYPFAEGGAWVEFPPDQELWDAPLAAGWVQAPRLRREMVELGAVAEQPQPAVAAYEPAAAPAAPDESGPAGGRSDDVALPAAFALAVASVVGLLVVRIPRRGRLSR